MLYRHALAVAVVPLLAGVVACSDGTVTLDEEKFDEGFGSVKSAVLVHDTEAGGDGYYVMLANRGGLCKDLQELLPQQYALEDDYAAAWDDFNEALFDWTNPNYVDAINAALNDLCEAQTVYLNGMTELYDTFVEEGDHFLVASFWNEDDYNIFPEEEVTYDTDASSSEDGFDLVMSYYFGNPYAPVADAWDEEACKSLDADQMATAFDDIWDAMDSTLDTWSADGGEATIKAKGDTKVVVEYSGGLEDMDGNDAGKIEGDFAAKLCEIE